MEQGQAKEMPRDRLANFEDDDIEDMTSILTPRPQAPTTSSANEDSRASSGRHVSAVPDPITSPADRGGEDEESTGPAAKATGRARKTTRPRRTGTTNRTARDRRTETPTAENVPAHSERKNKIKPSSVHIPTRLLTPVSDYCEANGMSNGQVVLTAIEFAHPHLHDLIHPATAGGGGLFAQRATRGARTHDGPLTPLNIRLYADDYEIIDKIVKDYGAFSRGHLVTVSLTYFFEHHAS